MDVGEQFLAVFALYCIVTIPTVLILRKKFKKEGRSVKNLDFKVATAIGLPLLSLPILFSDMPIGWKIISIIAMFLGSAGYWTSITSTQKTIERILGRKIYEDEDEESKKKE